MADIKTRDAVKGTIKTIDKAAIVTERMKSAYAKTKDKAEQGCYADESSATEYAADRLSYGADRIKDEGIHQFNKQGQKAVKETRENIGKANVLQLIFEKISAGNSIVPVSGYRSLEEQTAIYDGSLKDNGEDFTRKYVALPNHSEHQTGLAIDLGLNEKEIDFIRPDFPYVGICNEFRKAAPDYGFIERYAKDKEEITGISHEPWHFRYVGYPHSKIMQENGFSLEEYTQFIKAYLEDKKYLFEQAHRAEIEIYYVPAKDDKTLIKIPENCVYQISGNNIDGFVVTIWRKTDD